VKSQTNWLYAFMNELGNRFWKQSSTFRRLIFSRHVLDLQLIFLVTVLVTGALLWWHVTTLPKLTPGNNSVLGELDKQFVGAVLLISGTILAWAYQTGSKRLGVVDLFACEIITLCRVGTIMEVVQKLISAHGELSKSGLAREEPAPAQPTIDLNRFTSEEEYFPVFSQNTKDLQVLEADVVINVTAFYTYMKTFRDQFRSLTAIGSGQGSKEKKAAALVNAIYMLFLGYESARKSVEEMVEYEPTQAEAIVTGLISELYAYRFLTEHFAEDDMRGRRLRLREPKYALIVKELLATIGKAPSDDWENAKSTAVDLQRAFDLHFTRYVPPSRFASGHQSRPAA
jgi:hypothetical protein